MCVALASGLVLVFPEASRVHLAHGLVLLYVGPEGKETIAARFDASRVDGWWPASTTWSVAVHGPCRQEQHDAGE